jgi:nucleotide-binding universal stress UspA family protein
MPETGIVRDVVHQLERAAMDAGAERVCSVEVWLGASPGCIRSLRNGWIRKTPTSGTAIPKWPQDKHVQTSHMSFRDEHVRAPIHHGCKETNMYSKILVPVDGSEASTQGLQEAIKIAKQLGSHIRLLHTVAEFVFDSTHKDPAYVTDLIASMRDCGTAILAESEKLVTSQHIAHDTLLLESIGGSAADSIAQQAKEWQADLIVMGTHGRRGLRRLALGSDAEQVLRAATVPVLLVRGPSDNR